MKLNLANLDPLKSKINKLKFAVTVTLKKDVLAPQGKVVKQTLDNLGINSIKSVRQGKYFEIEVNEKDDLKAEIKVENMCKKLLVNLIIEDFRISKI